MDYFGFPTRSLSNPFLRLDYLTTIGPRLVRLVPAGTEINLLAETPAVCWDTPFGVYHVRGGHRLWAAPQNDLSTAIPDNDPLQIEELPSGIRLVQPLEAPTGLSKAIEVRLNPERAALTLTHTLTNRGVWPLRSLALGDHPASPGRDAFCALCWILVRASTATNPTAW